MLEERDARFDLIALALAVLTVFVGLALVTYNPADPPVQLVFPLNKVYQPDSLVYPVATHTTNLAGPWGSSTATILFEALGLGAYFFVATMGAIAFLMFTQHEWDAPVLRTMGWIGSMVGLTTLAAMMVPSFSPGPVIGSGGLLGALGAGVLKYYFADVGGFILAASLLIGGLLLCTDYVLVHLGLMLGALTLTGVFRGRAAADADEYEDEEGEEQETESTVDILPVRVGGRRMMVAESADEDEEEDDDEYEYEEDAYEEDDEEDDEEEEEVDESDDEYEEEADEEEEAEPAIAVKTPAASGEDEDDEEAASSDDGDTKQQLVRGRNGKRRLMPLRVRRPPEPEDREEVMNQLDLAALQEDNSQYELPSMELLQRADNFSYDDQFREVRRKAKILEQTFQNFNLNVKVVEIETGPVIAQYEVELEAGLRLSKITGLADDLAIALRVPSVRIVAPIPGKNTVGIEVPNEERQLVRLREVMNEARTHVKNKKMGIPIFLGKDVSGNSMAVDLAALPHLLIAGRTGTGKSVCLNAIIGSILMTRKPDEVRMLMIDPKMVELSGYKSLPHLMHPVVTDMRKAEAILAWAVDKMEQRYEMLARAGVRHMKVYNQLSEEELMERVEPADEEERAAIPLHMPYIVIVADEMADLMMTAGKDVEQHIIRLAQKSRAVGIHLILATQKPTVDVITGLIKSNLPARIAFQVASRTDSRVVLDEMGADKLLGNGDMLFLSPGTSTLIRGQGTFLSDDEINTVVSSCSKGGEQNFVKELVQMKVEDEATVDAGKIRKRDALYEQAIEVVIGEGRGSVSLLQRALSIGYGRAARLIDYMAEDGIVGTYAGSQAREVLMTLADWEAVKNGDVADDSKDASSGDEPAAPVAKSPTAKSTKPTKPTKPVAKKRVAPATKAQPVLTLPKAVPAAEAAEPEVATADSIVASAIAKVDSLIDEVADEEDEEEVIDELVEDGEDDDAAAEAEDSGEEAEYEEYEEDDEEYEYVYEDEDGNPIDELDEDEEYEIVDADEEDEYEYEYEDELEESA